MHNLRGTASASGLIRLNELATQIENDAQIGKEIAQIDRYNLLQEIKVVRRYLPQLVKE